MSDAHDSAVQAHAAHDGHGHHLIPYATYFKVWGALILLTLVTVAAAYANMHHMAVIVAILIAAAKSTLVILWFMHIKYEGRIFMWFLIAGFGTYAIFLILTFSDYAFR